MKMKDIKVVLKLVLVGIVIGSLLYIKRDVMNPDFVRAFGHLVVDMGVPSEQPIFTVNNMLPGDCTDPREIIVQNGGDSPSSLAVRSRNEIDNDMLSEVMNLTIEDNGDSYFDGTLSDFFDQSDSLDGVSLGNVSDGQSNTYFFTICFENSAGNQYQNTEVIFDLAFGEVISPIELPAECSHLSGEILFAIEGTDNDDDLDGSNESELILGYGGEDKLDGDSGNDCIVGGDGDDPRLDGGTGDDVIIGGMGNDEMDGGPGMDRIYGGAGDDEIEGDGEDDLVYGGDGNDDIDLGPGDDEAYGEEGDDVISGKGGDDYMDGGEDNDELDGGTGTDTCINGEVLDDCES